MQLSLDFGLWVCAAKSALSLRPRLAGQGRPASLWDGLSSPSGFPARLWALSDYSSCEVQCGQRVALMGISV